MDGVLLDSEHPTSQAAINYFAKKRVTLNHEDFIPFYGTGGKGFFGGVAAKIIAFHTTAQQICPKYSMNTLVRMPVSLAPRPVWGNL